MATILRVPRESTSAGRPRTIAECWFLAEAGIQGHEVARHLQDGNQTECMVYRFPLPRNDYIVIMSIDKGGMEGN
ncbi:MAG: hypothetical protein PHX10_11440 [Gallionellaceae bacterium]|nr:hypothetical protein [Gallionellaceae bacterium]